jgi:hypothetical protein
MVFSICYKLQKPIYEYTACLHLKLCLHMVSAYTFKYFYKKVPSLHKKVAKNHVT